MGRLDCGDDRRVALEMRRQDLRDRRGDTRAGWGGGRDGRYAAFGTAAQAAWSRRASRASRDMAADASASS
jgi:hypothetical protein